MIELKKRKWNENLKRKASMKISIKNPTHECSKNPKPLKRRRKVKTYVSYISNSTAYHFVHVHVYDLEPICNVTLNLNIKNMLSRDNSWDSGPPRQSKTDEIFIFYIREYSSFWLCEL